MEKRLLNQMSLFALPAVLALLGRVAVLGRAEGLARMASARPSTASYLI